MARLTRSRPIRYWTGGLVTVCFLLTCFAGIAAKLGTESSLPSTGLMSGISPSDAFQPPMIQAPEPADINYIAGQTGFVISWRVFGYHIGWTYEIFQNGNSILTGIANNTAYVNRSVDGLAPGIFNYTIRVTNDDGSTTDTVLVRVDVDPAVLNGTVWGIVIAFGCVGALIVIKVIKQVPLSPKKGRT